MALNIEDYAMISDCHTAALVGRDGSIDWLCMPRYDSASMFGALLGDEDHGRWLLAPEDENATCIRSYAGDTFILKTVWTTDSGEVEVLDFMPHRDDHPDVIRIVRGVSGTVAMKQDLRIRFGYAEAIPWVRQLTDQPTPTLVAVAGPDGVVIRGPQFEPVDFGHVSRFTVEPGETIDIHLVWFDSYREIPEPTDVDVARKDSAEWWKNWAHSCDHDGPYHDEVVRSILVLRALSNEQTGGIVAAATTSLPEQFGGGRNWDYRYVWLRDASLALSALLVHGYEEEAEAWRRWLLRAVAGGPEDVQIMYGIAGERHLPERELDSLPGYRGAAPVRVGNGAVGQFQADIIGEVMVALHKAREAGVEETESSWPLQCALMSYLEEHGERPDQGIWEMRGEPREFTHSRVMVWAAFDRAVRAVTDFGLDGPLERWTAHRDAVRRTIEKHGFDEERNTYTQSFGSAEVDASLLVLAHVGFCEPSDPRMLGTVAAIEEDLLEDGLLMRYRTESSGDGLEPGENAFLACSFWLVAQYANSGRLDEAKALMERLVGFANDVGLLSEEYDVKGARQAGNTPQAFSHLALVRAADAILAAGG
ncbi:MAG: glycoside hydrolase family 15 protein [Kineosporiaceae bacterium]|nr:glycoside hydrolase family 15 protein [Aeromicrobium sp.]